MNVLTYHFLVSCILKTFRVKIKRIRGIQMSKNDTPELALLIPQEGEKKWGEKRLVNKCDMVSLVTGYRHRMNNGRDSLYINKYLERVSVSGLNKLRFLQNHDFLPLGI